MPLRHLAATAATFAALVAIAVVGRWGQPDWCVTPMAAVGLMAGYALPRRWALATPVTAMILSDALLPAYGSWASAIVVYVAIVASPLLGQLLRRPLASHVAGAARLLTLAITPALLFFVVVNFAVWASGSMYPMTAAGLAECYVAAIPFLRSMLLGDLAYVAAIFGAALAAGAFSLKGAVANEAANATA